MRKMFIDLDGVVFNTLKIITEIYNIDHLFYKDFEVVDWHDINTWEFKELSLEPPEVIDSYFCTPRFFQHIELMKSAEWIIRLLSKHYKIIFCSSGRYANLQLKKMWISKKFPYADFIPVELPTYPDKSHILMRGENGNKNIFVDDNSSNLRTSNADIKICFGKEYSWNDDWDGVRCYSWVELYEYLKKEGLLC